MPPVALKVKRKHARADSGQYGPRKGEPLRRCATRIACLYAKFSKRSEITATPLEMRPLAKALGISYETMVRVTGDMAAGGIRMAWSYQHYHFIIFLKYRRHKTARCGHPQYYVISRYGRHRIGGEPGRKVRARLRQKSAGEWKEHLYKIKNLAMGILIRGRERADDKHKGSPQVEQEAAARARPPPAAKIAALRRWGGVAARLSDQYEAIPLAPRIQIFGWLLNRLSEWHDRDSIMQALRHVVRIIPTGRHQPANTAAWVCFVAERRLDADGLGIIQRRHEAKRKGRRSAPTLVEDVREVKIGRIMVDNDGVEWEHLGGTNWRKNVK